MGQAKFLVLVGLLHRLVQGVPTSLFTFKLASTLTEAWNEDGLHTGLSLVECAARCVAIRCPSWHFVNSTCKIGSFRGTSLFYWVPNGFGQEFYASHPKDPTIFSEGTKIAFFQGNRSEAVVFDAAKNAFLPSAWMSQIPDVGANQITTHGMVKADGFFACTPICYSLPFGASQWMEAGLSMLQARIDGASSVVREKLWVTGGHLSANGSVLTTSEIFDGNTWKLGPDLPEPLVGHCQVTLPDQTVLLAGGEKSRKTFKYDFVTGQWVELADMVHWLCFHECAYFVDDDDEYVMALGGKRYLSKDFLHQIMVYNLASNTWVKAGGLRPPFFTRRIQPLSLDGGRRVLLFDKQVHEFTMDEVEPWPVVNADQREDQALALTMFFT